MSEYVLKLYVAGQSARSISAVQNLREICEKYLSGRYELDVVDILEHPEIAESEHIIATPTVIVEAPQKGRRIVGDLSMTDRVLVGLGLRPAVWSSRKGTS